MNEGRKEEKKADRQEGRNERTKERTHAATENNHISCMSIVTACFKFFFLKRICLFCTN